MNATGKVCERTSFLERVNKYKKRFFPSFYERGSTVNTGTIPSQKAIQFNGGPVAKLDELFLRMGGSVKETENARVVFLGDTHGEANASPYVRMYIEKFLKERVKDGDIVLVEGYEKGLVVDRSRVSMLERLNPLLKVLILGWDNNKFRNEAKALFEEMDSFASVVAQSMETIEFDSVKQKFNDLESRATNFMVYKRNESLVSAVTDAAFRTKGKIYVIAGKEHLKTLDMTTLPSMPYIMLEPYERPQEQSADTTRIAVKKGKEVVKEKEKADGEDIDWIKVLSDPQVNMLAIVVTPSGKEDVINLGYLDGEFKVGGTVFIEQNPYNKGQSFTKDLWNEPLIVKSILTLEAYENS